MLMVGSCVGAQTSQYMRNIMVTAIARRRCPHCLCKVMVVKGKGEPLLCPNCLRFFSPAVPGTIPIWVWGVLTVLCAHLFLLQ